MVLTSQKEIFAEIKSFYAHLFENKDHGIITGQRMSSLNTLTKQESNKIEGILTLDEISAALKSMKNKKCPGIDGFPAKFFKIFWRKLKYFVLRALNCSFESGELSMSLRQCVITCLPDIFEELKTNLFAICHLQNCFIVFGFEITTNLK